VGTTPRIGVVAAKTVRDGLWTMPPPIPTGAPAGQDRGCANPRTVPRSTTDRPSAVPAARARCPHRCPQSPTVIHRQRRLIHSGDRTVCRRGTARPPAGPGPVAPLAGGDCRYAAREVARGPDAARPARRGGQAIAPVSRRRGRRERSQGGLSRRARRTIRQNLGFSLAVIAVLVAAALTVGIPLPLGVVGHEGSTVVVVLNGLRLLRTR
jgi:hypothetical protein